MAFDANNNEQKFSNFVHLHVHSDYSLLDGAAKIPSLVDRAVQLNMKALALTDHGNLFGAVKFADECKKRGIKPIIGEEFYVAENDHTSKEKNRWGKKYYHLILLCKDATGYKNISWLSSKAYTDGLHYKPRIDFNLLKEKHEGLICLSACLGGELPQALVNRDFSHAESVARRYKDLFGEDYYIELQNHGIPEQAAINPKLVELAKKLDIQLVITNDVHYCYKEDAESQDVLRCINFKQKLFEPHSTMGEGLTEWYLKSEEEMAKIFPDFPEALTNTLRIAEKCTFEFPKYTVENLRECLPRFPLPEQFSTQDEYVQHLVEEGLKKRYPEITEQIKARARHELDVIFKMGFSGYFLVVWEFIHWAKENKIPIGPGRGSGAGSLVAYAMEITDIDPFRFNLLFERFLNPERVSMPDFDIDIDNDYRQAVIQHTRDLYGSDHVGHIVTFGTLKAKAVLADVGRVLGIPLADVNMLKKCIADDAKSLKSAFEPPSEDHPDNGGLIKYQDDERYKKLFELCFKLENINKNASLHASGMVISLTPLPEWAPVFKDLKEGKEGVQYTMDVIEEKCGLVKMDYLGLKTLSVIRYTEDIINRHKKDGEKDFHVADVSETDKETFEMFARGDTIEVFQFESAGMQKTLRQAQPTKLEDLVALNALYRPGPMDNIPKFIEGRFHPDKIVYPDECLKDILEETYGIMVYQEQVMQVAQRIAGFTLGEADILRRAMGKKKLEVLMKEKEKFIAGAVKNGFSEKHADEIFELMVPFAGYGFNKSHAAAYTVLAYRTAWLKCHYGAEFMAANMTNEISSTDRLPICIEEARNMGITVEPPNINSSDVVFDVVDGKIFFGLKGIKGMGENAAEYIVKERNENGPYKDYMDFLLRMDFKTVGKKHIEILINAGAFDLFGINRPTLLNSLEEAIEYAASVNHDKIYGQEDLFGDTNEKVFADFHFTPIEDFPKKVKLDIEKTLVGCYVSGHPLDDYKKLIESSVTLTSDTIVREANQEKQKREAGQDSYTHRSKYSGKTYIVLGLISELRTLRTKKGDDMAIAKLQDYNGFIELTFFPEGWKRSHHLIKDNEVFALYGKIGQSKEGEPSFIVDSVADMNDLKTRSITEIHIEVASVPKSDKDITKLKDIVFENEGNCSIFFHLNTTNGPYIIKGGRQFVVKADKYVIDEIRELDFVKDAWAS